MPCEFVEKIAGAVAATAKLKEALSPLLSTIRVAVEFAGTCGASLLDGEEPPYDIEAT